MLTGRRRASGFTEIELLIAAAVGLLVTLASISLCVAGNRAVQGLVEDQRAWHELQAAAILWATEVRGAGFDPLSTAGARIERATRDTLEFSADWNASGALTPTSGNANERLAYALAAGAWKRGVNGGPRLIMARPDEGEFVYRDIDGRVLDATPDPGAIRRIEIRTTRTTRAGRSAVWTAAPRVVTP